MLQEVVYLSTLSEYLFCCFLSICLSGCLCLSVYLSVFVCLSVCILTLLLLTSMSSCAWRSDSEWVSTVTWLPHEDSSFFRSFTCNQVTSHMWWILLFPKQKRVAFSKSIYTAVFIRNLPFPANSVRLCVEQWRLISAVPAVHIPFLSIYREKE